MTKWRKRRRFRKDLRRFNQAMERGDHRKAGLYFDRLVDWTLFGNPDGIKSHNYPKHGPSYEGAPIMIDNKETWDRLVTEGKIRDSTVDEVIGTEPSNPAHRWA